MYKKRGNSGNKCFKAIIKILGDIRVNKNPGNKEKI